MEKAMENFIVPNYISEEILEYIEQTAQGRCRCMKWRNIQALLGLAVINGRITRKQADIVEKLFCREKWFFEKIMV